MPTSATFLTPFSKWDPMYQVLALCVALVLAASVPMLAKPALILGIIILLFVIIDIRKGVQLS